MKNVRVAVSKKGTLVGLIIAVLLLGGGGGYLLYRVNQEDTVAPTDSDASEYELECTGDCIPESSLPGYPESEKYAKICTVMPSGEHGYCLYKKTYTAYHITYTAGTGGSVSKAGQNSVTPGGSISSTATPNSGYKFVKWSDGETTATRRDSNVQADATYTATFEKLAATQVTLRYEVSPSAGGQVENANGANITGQDTLVNVGSTAKATAKANSGYKFVKWTKKYPPDNTVTNTDSQTTDATRTDSITRTITLIANFETQAVTMLKLNAEVVPSGGGKVFEGEGNNKRDITNTGVALSPGASYVLTAGANSGYKFVKWTKRYGSGPVEEVDTGSENPRKEGNINQSITLIANFTKTSSTDPVDCTGFKLTCGTDNTINVNWSLVSGSTMYIVRVNKAPKDDWVNAEGGDEWVSLDNNVTSYVIRNVESGVAYSVNVMAYDGPDGEKDFHPSCNMTGLGQVWDPAVNKEISCAGTTPIVDSHGGGTVPDTAIFEDTQDTIIFGIVVLMVGIGWTWVSTLPKRAYSSISKASTEFVSNAKATKERNIRESRRNKLEKRLK